MTMSMATATVLWNLIEYKAKEYNLALGIFEFAFWRNKNTSRSMRFEKGRQKGRDTVTLDNDGVLIEASS